MRLSNLALLLALSACATTPEERMEQRGAALMKARSEARGDVALKCTPEDAEVMVDGVPQGMCSDFDGTSRGLTVGDGLHRIEVSRTGYVPNTTYYEPSGVKATFKVDLRPRDP